MSSDIFVIVRRTGGRVLATVGPFPTHEQAHDFLDEVAHAQLLGAVPESITAELSQAVSPAAGLAGLAALEVVA